MEYNNFSFALTNGDLCDAVVYGKDNIKTIIFVNAIGLRKEFSRKICISLSDRYKVVCWDYRGLPGNGLLTESDLKFFTHEEELHGLMNTIGSAEYYLMGYCSGVHLVYSALRNHGEKIVGASLINGHYNFSDSKETKMRKMYVRVMDELFNSKEKSALYYKVLSGSVSKNLGSSFGLGKEMLQEYIEEIYRSGPEKMYTYFRMLREYRNTQWFPCYIPQGKSINIFSCRNDQIASYEQSEKLHSILGSSVYHCSDDGDHYCVFSSDAYIGKIRDYVTRVF